MGRPSDRSKGVKLVTDYGIIDKILEKIAKKLDNSKKEDK